MRDNTIDVVGKLIPGATQQVADQSRYVGNLHLAVLVAVGSLNVDTGSITTEQVADQGRYVGMMSRQHLYETYRALLKQFSED